MYVTTRTIQTLPGQQLAFVDAWISAAAHPLQHQPGFKHVFVLAPPAQADTVIIFLAWKEMAHMQAWVTSAAHQRVQERLASLWQGEPTPTDYTLFFEMCACSHHFNLDAVPDEAQNCSGAAEG